jgi:tRNA(adenine34) deaminase
MTADIDELWMRRALSVARRAGARGEVPVGAIAVRDGERISTASNRMENGHDATAHAEMLCLRRAASRMQSWRLNDVTLYVTLEPCPMCASAMVLSRLGRLVYAAKDPKKGADGSAYRLLDHPANNHRVSVRPGVMAGEASAMLSTFFQELRAC